MRKYFDKNIWNKLVTNRSRSENKSNKIDYTKHSDMCVGIQTQPSGPKDNNSAGPWKSYKNIPCLCSATFNQSH